LALFLSAFSGFRIDRHNWGRNWHVNWGHLYDRHAIRGNGISSEKTVDFDGTVEYVEIGKNLIANLKIEQIQSGYASIIISGDGNLIEQVKYNLSDGRLKLTSDNPLRSENNLIIRLLTSDIKGVKSNVVGNIQMNHAFLSDELEINMSGPSRFSADSLLVQTLKVRSEGIASVRLSGKANNTRLELSGTGKIDAFELLSDTVYARLEGIGSIQCNPIDYLEGRLQGIGKITYKYEPKVKNITSEGIGKIGKE